MYSSRTTRKNTCAARKIKSGSASSREPWTLKRSNVPTFQPKDMSDDYKPVLRPGSDPVVFFRPPGSEDASPIARGHIMAVAMAHALRDGEVVFMGANSLLPL